MMDHSHFSLSFQIPCSISFAPIRWWTKLLLTNTIPQFSINEISFSRMLLLIRCIRSCLGRSLNILCFMPPRVSCLMLISVYCCRACVFMTAGVVNPGDCKKSCFWIRAAIKAKPKAEAHLISIAQSIEPVQEPFRKCFRCWNMKQMNGYEARHCVVRRVPLPTFFGRC